MSAPSYADDAAIDLTQQGVEKTARILNGGVQGTDSGIHARDGWHNKGDRSKGAPDFRATDSVGARMFRILPVRSGEGDGSGPADEESPEVGDGPGCQGNRQGELDEPSGMEFALDQEGKEVEGQVAAGDGRQHGYPIRLSNMLADLEGVAFVGRCAVNSAGNVELLAAPACQTEQL